MALGVEIGIKTKKSSLCSSALRLGEDFQVAPLAKARSCSTKPCVARRVETGNRDGTGSTFLWMGERGKSVRSDRHGPTSWLSLTLTEGKFHQVLQPASESNPYGNVYTSMKDTDATLFCYFVSPLFPFHQVRKMTAAVGFPTLRLVRVRVGPWDLRKPPLFLATLPATTVATSGTEAMTANPVHVDKAGTVDESQFTTPSVVADFSSHGADASSRDISFSSKSYQGDRVRILEQQLCLPGPLRPGRLRRVSHEATWEAVIPEGVPVA